jgi:hypothetical protein
VASRCCGLRSQAPSLASGTWSRTAFENGGDVLKKKLAFMFLTQGEVYHEELWIKFFMGFEERYRHRAANTLGKPQSGRRSAVCMLGDCTLLGIGIEALCEVRLSKWVFPEPLAVAKRFPRFPAFHPVRPSTAGGASRQRSESNARRNGVRTAGPAPACGPRAPSACTLSSNRARAQCLA